MNRIFCAILACLLPLTAHAQPKPVTPEGGSMPAPIALSDPDGQDLILEDLSVRAAVSGMLSLTEIEMRFRNPQSRRMEGRFSCVLPAGATISRFAKEVNGRLMEGEVVERLRANKVYDEILQQMRDPALLEQDQGNRFSARVFPIEAGATVRLVLSYSRLLPLQAGVRTFDFPLRGLPTIGRFSFHGVFAALPGEISDELAKAPRLEGPAGASQATVQVMDFGETAFTPQRDVQIRWRPATSAAPVRVLRAGDFYLAAFAAPTTVEAAAPARKGWTFYVDTSASGAEGQPHRIGALAALLASLPADDPVEIVAFDQTLATLLSGPSAEVGNQIGPALTARLFLGGTDLEAALKDLASRAVRDPNRRYVLVSDGVATLGKTERRDLLAALSGLPPRTALHALVLGSREDRDVLAALTEGRGRVVSLPFSDSLSRAAKEAAATLAVPTGLTVNLADEAAEWLLPGRVTDVQPGAEVIAIGKAKPGVRPAPRLEVGGRVIVQADAKAEELPMGTFAPLLEREGFRAYLQWLAAREAAEPDEGIRRALATEQVRVSVEHRVLIPRTTLLVLETEEDYRRFALDRRALAEILTVGPAGLDRVDRTKTGPIAVPSAPKPGPLEPTPTAKSPPRKNGLLKLLEMKSKKESDIEDETVAADLLGATADVEEETQKADLGGGDAVMGAPAPAELAVERPSPQPDARPEPPSPPAAADRMPGEGRVARGPRERPLVRQPHPPSLSGTAEGIGAGGGGRPLTPEKPRRPDWTAPVKPSRQEVEALRAHVRENPSDRTAWNRLAEDLASLGEWKALRELALAWQPRDPENPQVYESLGEADLALGKSDEAVRAFASLIEVAPAKTELLQRAGLLLLRAKAAGLAEVPLRRALELRPDRVNGYRHLALVLWQLGRFEDAARVLEDATRRSFPDWYGDVHRVIREELAYVYRDWANHEPARRDEIRKRAADFGADLGRTDALRVTLAWETDANDVDLHVVDPGGEECFYSHKNTATGLELYQDITRGFGPEVVRTDRVVKGEYAIGVNYFSAGPMGVSRGVLVVLRPVSKGTADVRILPFRLVEGSREMRLLAVYRIE